jgi:hypothetical protein
MRLVSIHDDIFDAAPRYADAAMLWIRSGFNGRHSLWSRFVDRHWDAFARIDRAPWQRESPAALGKLVRHGLAQLADQGARSVALIHIPIRGTADERSAAVLVAALEAWDHAHPGRIDAAFLIDLADGFRDAVGCPALTARAPRGASSIAGR